MSLQEKIETYISSLPASFGISIKHLGTREEANVQADRYFQVASVFKVPILATLYEAAYNGEIDLNERVVLLQEDRVPGSGVFQEMAPGIVPTIKDLATLMIIVSDNLATDKLLKLLGKERVEQKMRDIGLDQIFIRHSCWELLSLSAGIPPQEYSEEMFTEIIDTLIRGNYDPESTVFTEETDNNVSTPRDMSRLMEQIALGEFVSEECSAAIRDVLFRQQYTQRIPGLLPRGKKVANKTGSLGTYYNDTGIVYLPEGKGEYVITVFSYGENLDYEGNEPIARISRIAYDHFMEGQ